MHSVGAVNNNNNNTQTTDAHLTSQILLTAVSTNNGASPTLNVQDPLISGTLSSNGSNHQHLNSAAGLPKQQPPPPASSSFIRWTTPNSGGIGSGAMINGNESGEDSVGPRRSFSWQARAHPAPINCHLPTAGAAQVKFNNTDNFADAFTCSDTVSGGIGCLEESAADTEEEEIDNGECLVTGTTTTTLATGDALLLGGKRNSSLSGSRGSSGGSAKPSVTFQSDCGESARYRKTWI